MICQLNMLPPHIHLFIGVEGVVVVKLGLSRVCGHAFCRSDVIRLQWDGVLIGDVGEFSIQVVILHTQRQK